MSQPKDFEPGEKDPLGSAIKSIDQLVELFHKAERPKDQWLLGIEYEMFGQIDHGLNPLPYEGPTSITSLFHHLADKTANKPDRFFPLMEGENIVGLKCERAIIALEPGGQVEIALNPHHSLLETTREFSSVLKEVVDAAQDLNIEFFALGIHPRAKREDMAVVKKARYGIMRNHMSGLDGLGLDMMTRSCAIQINMDYQDEADMAKKTKKAAILMPIYALLCSSSAFIENKPSTRAIMRSHIWQKTDPLRTGIPKIIFDKDFGYSSWVQMALDVPMYFIRRGNTYYDVRGASFREFMRHGLLGQTALVRDFVDHLSTIFTEVRLKPILELRSPDSLPLAFVNAITALSYALLYDDRGSSLCEKLFADISHDELLTLRHDIIEHGRKAKFRGKEIFFLTRELLNIADETLKAPLNSLLSPLIKLVDNDTTVAEWIRSNFPKLDDENLRKLIKSFGPFSTLP